MMYSCKPSAIPSSKACFQKSPSCQIGQAGCVNNSCLGKEDGVFILTKNGSVYPIVFLAIDSRKCGIGIVNFQKPFPAAGLQVIRMISFCKFSEIFFYLFERTSVGKIKCFIEVGYFYGEWLQRFHSTMLMVSG